MGILNGESKCRFLNGIFYGFFEWGFLEWGLCEAFEGILNGDYLWGF